MSPTSGHTWPPFWFLWNTSFDAPFESGPIRYKTKNQALIRKSQEPKKQNVRNQLYAIKSTHLPGAHPAGDSKPEWAGSRLISSPCSPAPSYCTQRAVNDSSHSSGPCYPHRRPTLNSWPCFQLDCCRHLRSKLVCHRQSEKGQQLTR